MPQLRQCAWAEQASRYRGERSLFREYNIQIEFFDAGHIGRLVPEGLTGMIGARGAQHKEAAATTIEQRLYDSPAVEHLGQAIELGKCLLQIVDAMLRVPFMPEVIGTTWQQCRCCDSPLQNACLRVSLD